MLCRTGIFPAAPTELLQVSFLCHYSQSVVKGSVFAAETAAMSLYVAKCIDSCSFPEDK